MTIDERIKQAKKKRNEAYKKDSVQGIVYWDGYLAALKDIKADEERAKMEKQIDTPTNTPTESQYTKCIEERRDLAEIIYMSGYGLYRNDSLDIATQIQANGYRKASEVAREIFEEIKDVLNNIGYFDEIDFDALKKKYAEGEG